jgi:hypothetical protein
MDDGSKRNDPAVSVHRKVTGGEEPEALEVVERLNHFDADSCGILPALHQMYGGRVTHAQLRSIATVACQLTGLSLDRDAGRDNRVLIQWYSNNWNRLLPVLPFIHLRDENYQIISGARR